MIQLNQSNADAVVELFNDHFEKLPKSGKPGVDEWTVAAGIVELSDSGIRIVAFGTGSKCIGQNRLTPDGDLVHDGHAEVLARRGFLVYLLEEVASFGENRESRVFGSDGGRLIVKDNVRYWMVSSLLPCGDASIMPMGEEDICGRKRKRETVEGPAEKVFVDIHRTGAKCLPVAEIQDEKLPGVSYHVTGQIRTKPGRGDPTASVSCSDKLARWNAVGMQGALLSLLINPIFIEALIITGGTNYSQDSLERAINTRIGSPKKLQFFQSGLNFPATRSTIRHRPSACSIAWNLATQRTEVCVEGRRLGATKKRPGPLLDITKKNIHLRFLRVVSHLTQLPVELTNSSFNGLTYRQLKDLSTDYQENWQTVKNNYFHYWTKKPDFIEKFKQN